MNYGQGGGPQMAPPAWGGRRQGSVTSILRTNGREAEEITQYVDETSPTVTAGCLTPDGSYLAEFVYPDAAETDAVIFARVGASRVTRLMSHAELPGISRRGEADVTGDGVPDWLLSTRTAGDSEEQICETSVLSPAHPAAIRTPLGCLHDESRSTIGIGRIGTTSALFRVEWDTAYGGGRVFSAWAFRGPRLASVNGGEIAALEARASALANAHSEATEALRELEPHWASSPTRVPIPRAFSGLANGWQPWCATDSRRARRGHRWTV